MDCFGVGVAKRFFCLVLRFSYLITHLVLSCGLLLCVALFICFFFFFLNFLYVFICTLELVNYLNQVLIGSLALK